MFSGIHLFPENKKNKLRNLLLGVLLFIGLIIVVTHIGELEACIKLLQETELSWLVWALILQFLTYLSVAAIWYRALVELGVRCTYLSLVPLSVAKLFSDKAVPSIGVSGAAFFVAALNRRAIPSHASMATIILSLVTYYSAYLIAALVTLSLLYFYHAIRAEIILLMMVFLLLATSVPAFGFWLQNRNSKEWPLLLNRLPLLTRLIQSLESVPQELLHKPGLILLAIVLHCAVFILDAMTLWIMLAALNIHLSFWSVFPSFMIASIVTTVGPIPLGVGSFETSCVAMLGVMGVPIEAALTATLLLRGFTLWLPMLPGMLLVRWALR